MMGGRADVVLSDMAANTTGHRKTDQLRIIGLVEGAAAFAAEVLNPGGTFVAKVFQSGADAGAADAAEARLCQRPARQAGLEPAGFLRALRAGDGISRPAASRPSKDTAGFMGRMPVRLAQPLIARGDGFAGGSSSASCSRVGSEITTTRRPDT